MNVTTIPVGSTGIALEGVAVSTGVRESVILTSPSDPDGFAEIVSSQPIQKYGLPVWVQGTPSVAVGGTTSTQIVSSIPFYVAQSSAPWTMNGAVAVTSNVTIQGTSSVQVLNTITIQGTSSVNVLNVPTVNVTNVPLVTVQGTSSANVLNTSVTNPISARLSDGTGFITSDLVRGNRFIKASIIQDIEVSSSNATTTNIVPTSSFTGVSDSTLGVASIQISIFADQNCSAVVQQAQEDPGVNWNIIDGWNYTASSAGQDATRTIQAMGASFRTIVTNTGSNTTTAFRVNSILCPYADPLPRGLTQLGNLKTSINEGSISVTNSPNVNVTNVPAVNITSSIPFFVAQSSAPWTVSGSTQIVSSIPFFVAQSSSPWTFSEVATTAGGTNATTIALAGTLNTTVVKGSAGQVYGIFGSNVGSSNVFVRIYNQSTAALTIASTAVPLLVFGMPISTSPLVLFDMAVAFNSGISIITQQQPYTASTSTPPTASTATITILFK